MTRLFHYSCGIYFLQYISRRSLLSQVEARAASELLLKEDAKALVSSSSQPTNQHQPVDISIDIEVSGVAQSSSSLPQHTDTLTSFAPFEESVVKEREAFSEDVAGEGGQQQRRPSSLKLSPRSQRRQSKKPVVTQLFQLEVSGWMIQL